MYGVAESIGVLEHPLVRRLIALNLDRKDFVIFGSGPLLAHRIRANIRDLDVVTRGDAWRRVSQLGVPATGAVSGAPMVHFWGGRIQFSQEWIFKIWDTDNLIDRADIIEGLRFAPLADVLVYKRMLMRPKDKADIHVLTDLLDQRTDTASAPAEHESASTGPLAGGARTPAEHLVPAL